MQFEAENEKVLIMNAPYTPVPNRSSLKNDPEIKRARTVLMVLLGVCLAICVLSLIFGLSGNQPKTEGGNVRRTTQNGETLISMLFFGFGLFAVYRRSSLCLRIFGVLLIIQSIVLIVLSAMLLIVIIMILFPTILTENQRKKVDRFETNGVISSCIIAILSLVLTIITAVLTLRLARLIDAKKPLVIQTI